MIDIDREFTEISRSLKDISMALSKTVSTEYIDRKLRHMATNSNNTSDLVGERLDKILKRLEKLSDFVGYSLRKQGETIAKQGNVLADILRKLEEIRKNMPQQPETQSYKELSKLFK